MSSGNLSKSYSILIPNFENVLPFLPSTSDGGFAVSNHDQIEDSFGNWNDLKNLSTKHKIMADLVLNHVSSSHPWVHQFMKSEEPGSSYIVSSPDTNIWDISRPVLEDWLKENS